MQSLIIVGRDIEKVKEEIGSIFRKNKINPVDTSFYIAERAFGIGEARQLQTKAALSPIKSPARGFAIIAASGITLDAQNALLKTLEEPVDSTFIVLGVQSTEILLPTILSRCKVIELKEKGETYKENPKILKAEDLTLSEKLKLAQDYSKTREDAISFLEESIVSARNKMTRDPSPSYFKLLKALQKAHKDISTTNVSPRFALENLFLNL